MDAEIKLRIEKKKQEIKDAETRGASDFYIEVLKNELRMIRKFARR